MQGLSDELSKTLFFLQHQSYEHSSSYHLFILPRAKPDSTINVFFSFSCFLCVNFGNLIHSLAHFGYLFTFLTTLVYHKYAISWSFKMSLKKVSLFWSILNGHSNCKAREMSVSKVCMTKSNISTNVFHWSKSMKRYLILKIIFKTNSSKTSHAFFLFLLLSHCYSYGRCL